MLRISVVNRQHSVKINVARMKRHARRILRATGLVNAELSLAFVDDADMRLLNATYRKLNEPTDVLAFAMTEGRFSEVNPQLLGDVVISAETAAFRARREGRPTSDELNTLLVHGILHLLGYDHERSAADARVMRAKERAMRRLIELPA
ncbi:MAG: rRNA maturation RNase YbeY [Nitrospirota bacterium]